MITEYITWTREDGYDAKDLAKAVKVIKEGGLVAFPTETVYGLGGDGLRSEVSEKIYEAKGRPSDNPLILHISSVEQLDGIVEYVNDKAKAIMDAFWPGPMTLIFKKKSIVPETTTGGLDTVAVRMPVHEGAREFIEACGVPIAAPSANTSGRPSPTTAEHVKEDLDSAIDMVIDGGDVGIGFESTIIDMVQMTPVILRPGYITKEMIEEVIGDVVVDPGISPDNKDAKPKAPGMKYRHYAPKSPMAVYDGPKDMVINRINAMARQYPSERVGILTTTEGMENYTYGKVLSIGSNVDNTVGRNLYGALREFDRLGVEIIFSESFFEDNKSEAIMNRLLKAAGGQIVKLVKNDYKRVVFVCKENVYLSPMAEWIFKSILMDKTKEVFSRGLVVLFSEPMNQKVIDLLGRHSIPCKEQVSVEFNPDEITDDTLVIAMNFSEKVKLVEGFGLEENVYTLKEFIEEDEDVIDPYGGTEKDYEECYLELKDHLYQMKKKLEWD